MIKSRRMCRVAHIVRVGEMINAYTPSVGKPEEKNHLGYQGVPGRIVFGLRMWTESIRLGEGSSGQLL
jgi:hypothetical protein